MNVRSYNILTLLWPFEYEIPITCIINDYFTHRNLIILGFLMKFRFLPLHEVVLLFHKFLLPSFQFHYYREQEIYPRIIF